MSSPGEYAQTGQRPAMKERLSILWVCKKTKLIAGDTIPNLGAYIWINKHRVCFSASPLPQSDAGSVLSSQELEVTIVKYILMGLGHQWKINLTLTIALLVLHCSFVTSQALQAVLVLVGGGVQPKSRCPWQSFTSLLHCLQKAVARWRPVGSQQPVSPSQVSSTAVSGSHLTDSFCFLFSCPRARSVVISSYKQYPHFFAPQFIPFPCKTEGEKTRGEEKNKKKTTIC